VTAWRRKKEGGGGGGEWDQEKKLCPEGVLLSFEKSIHCQKLLEASLFLM
jgi:hypothetical protein